MADRPPSRTSSAHRRPPRPPTPGRKEPTSFPILLATPQSRPLSQQTNLRPSTVSSLFTLRTRPSSGPRLRGRIDSAAPTRDEAIIRRPKSSTSISYLSEWYNREAERMLELHDADVDFQMAQEDATFLTNASFASARGRDAYDMKRTMANLDGPIVHSQHKRASRRSRLFTSSPSRKKTNFVGTKLQALRGNEEGLSEFFEYASGLMHDKVRAAGHHIIHRNVRTIHCHTPKERDEHREELCVDREHRLESHKHRREASLQERTERIRSRLDEVAGREKPKSPPPLSLQSPWEQQQRLMKLWFSSLCHFLYIHKLSQRQRMDQDQPGADLTTSVSGCHKSPPIQSLLAGLPSAQRSPEKDYTKVLISILQVQFWWFRYRWRMRLRRKHAATEMLRQLMVNEGYPQAKFRRSLHRMRAILVRQQRRFRAVQVMRVARRRYHVTLMDELLEQDVKALDATMKALAKEIHSTTQLWRVAIKARKAVIGQKLEEMQKRSQTLMKKRVDMAALSFESKYDVVSHALAAREAAYGDMLLDYGLALRRKQEAQAQIAVALKSSQAGDHRALARQLSQMTARRVPKIKELQNRATATVPVPHMSLVLPSEEIRAVLNTAVEERARADLIEHSRAAMNMFRPDSESDTQASGKRPPTHGGGGRGLHDGKK